MKFLTLIRLPIMIIEGKLLEPEMITHMKEEALEKE